MAPECASALSRLWPKPIRVATRGTPLAKVQAGLAIGALKRAHASVECELVIVHTKGDLDTDRPISALAERGVFTKSLQTAVFEGRADLAVHSYKDVPTPPVPGLTTAAVLARGDPREALVAGPLQSLCDFAAGARIGTSSPRRSAQVLLQRKDLNVVPLRGSVGTRVDALKSGQIQGTVMAVAGLQRAGLTSAISAVLGVHHFLPAPAQGALMIEARSDRPDVLELVAPLDDPLTRSATTAGRAFLDKLEGGCSLPAAALAEIDHNDQLTLNTAVYTSRGAVRSQQRGPCTQATALGRAAAAKYLTTTKSL